MQTCSALKPFVLKTLSYLLKTCRELCNRALNSMINGVNGDLNDSGATQAASVLTESSQGDASTEEEKPE